MTPAAIAGSLVTPVILTFNEEPNIGRALRSLEWAADVVVIDSGSTDATEHIAKGFPNVRWMVRPFDRHAEQWSFAVRSTGVRTQYVLALDADYSVPGAFVDELAAHFQGGTYAGGIAGFEYRIDGRPLLGSVYPPKLVVFRPDRIQIAQPGHTQELSTEGAVHRFTARLVHDDRKPLSRFIRSQMEYARLEALRIRNNGALRWQDRVRRAGVMPLIAGVAAYVKAGGPLSGSAALRYACERMTFECLLALRLLGNDSRS